MIHTSIRALQRLLAVGLFASVGLAQSYCNCTPGLGPCGNDIGAGLIGGCINSTGARAFLGPIGSTSVGTDDMIFVATQMPATLPVMLVMGPESVQLPFGDGLLCVGPGSTGLERFTPKSISNFGTSNWGPGLVGYAKANFPSDSWIKAGQTWHFQAWYRDLDGPCNQGTNLTNGLTLTFVP